VDIPNTFALLRSFVSCSSMALTGNSMSAVQQLRQLAAELGDPAAIGSRCIETVMRSKQQTHI
jgi:hypothetical protein